MLFTSNRYSSIINEKNGSGECGAEKAEAAQALSLGSEMCAPPAAYPEVCELHPRPLPLPQNDVERVWPDVWRVLRPEPLGEKSVSQDQKIGCRDQRWGGRAGRIKEG